MNAEKRVLHMELTSCGDCPHRGSLEVDTTGGIGDDSVPFCHLLARLLDNEVQRYLVVDPPDRRCRRFDHECPLPKAIPDVAAIEDEGRRLERERCLEAVDAEPELPGEMPDEMWAAIREDRDAAAEAMRIIVRQTKAGIRARIEEV